MVETFKTRKSARPLSFGVFIIAVFLLSYFGMTWKAYPKGIQAASTILDEELTMELNSVGDAHVTDVLTYDKAWFNSNGSIFQQYPFLLSRHLQDESNLREVENFSSNVDLPNYTITLTFDVPGAAYNDGNQWTLINYPDKPKFEKEGQLIFESESTENNEFTLWSDMHVNYTQMVVPPPSSTNAHYDSANKQVVYELPYLAKTSSNPLATNKALFIVIFALLMLIGLGGVVLLLMRKTAPMAGTVPYTAAPTATEGMPPITIPSAPGAPPSPPTVEPAQVDGIQPAAAPAEPVAEVQQEEGSKFCKFCGGTLKHAGAKFCSSCGKEQA